MSMMMMIIRMMIVIIESYIRWLLYGHGGCDEEIKENDNISYENNCDSVDDDGGGCDDDDGDDEDDNDDENDNDDDNDVDGSFDDKTDDEGCYIQCCYTLHLTWYLR